MYSVSITGSSSDISLILDPDTGQAVSGRQASVVIRLATLSDMGLGIPVGVEDTDRKPWLITVDDITGVEHIFKVQESNPDRTLGVVLCKLELYTI